MYGSDLEMIIMGFVFMACFCGITIFSITYLAIDTILIKLGIIHSPEPAETLKAEPCRDPKLPEPPANLYERLANDFKDAAEGEGNLRQTQVLDILSRYSGILRTIS